MTTRLVCGRAARGAMVLLVLGFTASQGADNQKPPADLAEPPLEFSLAVDGTTQDVVLDKPFEIDAGGRRLSLTISMKPWRVFSSAGVTFKYPSYYAFEAESDPDGSANWTFTGNDNTLMFFKYPGSDQSPAEAQKAVLESAIESYGRKNIRQADCTLKAAGQTLRGKRLDIKIGEIDVEIRQDLYAFATDQATFVLIVQDSLDDGRKTTAETTGATKLLSESLEFTPRRGRKNR
jgi:hypothetical protein